MSERDAQKQGSMGLLAKAKLLEVKYISFFILFHIDG